MLNINNVSKVFNEGTINEIKVIDKLNVAINDGEFLTIVGSNGAGKSTLLNLIAGSFNLDEGNVILQDNDISNISEHKKAKFIARVFQDPTKGTSPSMTILENLSLADNKGRRFGFSFGIDKRKIEFFKEQLAILNLGLENKLNTKVGLLSGGQRQALSLLMATLKTPKLLLLDEHTAALDPKTSETIMQITDKIVKEKDITTLMITHNLNHALDYGNRIVMMHQGKIVLDKQGISKKSLTKEKLIEQFNSVTLNGDFDDRVILA
ncbi:putative ABC transport system ATP-binding protein [Clostridium cavendishii DSM 21758]|uniref:Putative ABC transport system ATP-binding protein n=1 Tax=Clostridium cavendishii DSM 21758 TaxID=1121302 RepID=A0A1M6SKR6_9CLOT|nr:ATP-binding cassette domain-containing protein [Clostridium cavendishii]SHK45374.1 putative ABC transport system ATP-binding protein [Clostridium cavendishii DSM 21758]